MKFLACATLILGASAVQLESESQAALNIEAAEYEMSQDEDHTKDNLKIEKSLKAFDAMPRNAAVELEEEDAEEQDDVEQEFLQYEQDDGLDLDEE